MSFSEAAEVNPRRTVERGTLAPFVDMATLSGEIPHVRPSRVKPVGVGGSRFTNGDTLFARITPCTENGKTGLVGGLTDGQVGTGSTEFIVLGPREQVTLAEFVYYLAKDPAFRSFAISRMRGTSGRQRVPTSAFEEYEVGVPPLFEQRKIAAILSSVDETIGKTQAVIDQLWIVKRGMTQELLTAGLPRQHIQFKRTSAGRIPKDWSVDRIEDLGQDGRPAVKAGPFGSSLKKSFYVSTGYRVYGQEQVLAGDLSQGDYYIDERRFQSLKSCAVKSGDILMSLVGTFGKAIVVPEGHAPGIINPRLLRLSLDPRLILPEFFCHWLQCERTRKRLRNAAQGGTMGVLNAGIVKKLTLGRPPLDEQAEIVASLTAIERRLDRENATKTAVSQVKSALMSVLLTGELRVTPDPGPA